MESPSAANGSKLSSPCLLICSRRNVSYSDGNRLSNLAISYEHVVYIGAYTSGSGSVVTPTAHHPFSQLLNPMTFGILWLLMHPTVWSDDFLDQRLGLEAPRAAPRPGQAPATPVSWGMKSSNWLDIDIRPILHVTNLSPKHQNLESKAAVGSEFLKLADLHRYHRFTVPDPWGSQKPSSASWPIPHPTANWHPHLKTDPDKEDGREPTSVLANQDSTTVECWFIMKLAVDSVHSVPLWVILLMPGSISPYDHSPTIQFSDSHLPSDTLRQDRSFFQLWTNYA